MSDYLSTYGAGEAERAHSIKKWLLIVLGVVVVGGVLALVFRNFGEKRELSRFLDNVRKQDFQTAYAQFGCTAATPCPNYTMAKFMEDWGPQSAHKDFSQAGTEAIRSCKTSLIEGVTLPGGDMIPVAIQRDNHTISFAPYPYSDLSKKPERGLVGGLRWWLGDLFYSC